MSEKYVFKAISPDTLEVENIEVEVPDLSKLENSELIEQSVPESAIETRTQDMLSVESQILLAEADCLKAIAKYDEWLNWWDYNQASLVNVKRDDAWQSVTQAYQAAVYQLQQLASVKGVNSIYDQSLPRILLPIQNRSQRRWAEPTSLKKSVSQLTPNVVIPKIDILKLFIMAVIFVVPLILSAILFAVSPYLSIFSCLILYVILFFWFKSHREALAIRRGEVDIRRRFYLNCRNINPTAKETMDAMRRWNEAKAELQVLQWYRQFSLDNMDE